MKQSRTTGACLVVASSLFYASYGIWTTLMGDFFGGYTASGIRSILVVAILLPVVLYLHKGQPLQWRKYAHILAGMTVASMLIWGPLYYAILEIGVALSLSVNYCMIVIGFLFFGWLFAGEQLTKTKAISATLGIVGLVLVFVPGLSGTVSLIGLAGALLSGFAIGANTVLAKKLPYNSLQSTLVVWLISLIANLPLAFVLQEPMPLLAWSSERLYIILFAISSILSTRLLLAGMKHIDAGSAGILGLLEIVFGVLFGVFLFHEKLDLFAGAGIVLIVVAAAYPYVVRLQTKNAEEDLKSQ